MAVRQGYGKVATNGLVFAYDTGDTVNSYKGEPTENLVTNPTFLGTSGTQTSATSDNWVFSGDSSAAGFNFYDSSTSPIPLKFPNEGAVITTGTTSSNRRIYFRGPVQPSTTYTLSYWIYSTAQTSVSNYFFTYDSGSNIITTDTYIFSKSVTTGTWYYVEQSYTTPSNTDNTENVYWGPVINGTSDTLVALQRFQVEVNSHATPFVNGTRSATQGLLDLTGNTSIDLSDVSFDSNAQIDFDGTDDRVNYIGPVYSRLSSSATEVIFKAESFPSQGFAMIFGYRHVGGNYSQFTTGPIGLRSNNTIFSSVITTSQVYRSVSSSTISLNKYYHVVLNKDTQAGTLQLYVNGELVSSNTFDTETYSQWSTAGNYIGTDYLEIGGLTNSSSPVWTRYLDGSVTMGKLYSRTLTADEVRNNYRHYKNRFNI